MDGQVITDAGAGAATTPPVTQAPAWHESLITKDSAGVESLRPYAEWQNSAPAPLRDFINANMTAARQKTEGMIRVPGPDAKPEEWEPVWNAIGRPAKPEEYGIAKPEQMPDGVEWNDEFAGKFIAQAHKLGMPKGMAQGLLAWHTERMGEESAAMRQAAEQHVAAERAELAKVFGPKLADVAASAQNAARASGVDPELFNPGAGKFAGVGVLRMVAAMGEKLAKFNQEGSFSAGQGKSPMEGGKEWANQVINDRSHPDYDKFYGLNGKAVDPAFQKKVMAAANGSV